MDELPETDTAPMLDLLIWRLAEANRVVIETPNALGLADAHYMPAKPILDALVGNRGRIKALEAENAALREAAERLLVMQGDVMADVIFAQSIKNGWPGWRPEADHDFRSVLRRAFERLRAALARQTEGEG